MKYHRPLPNETKPHIILDPVKGWVVAWNSKTVEYTLKAAFTFVNRLNRERNKNRA